MEIKDRKSEKERRSDTERVWEIISAVLTSDKWFKISPVVAR